MMSLEHLFTSCTVVNNELYGITDVEHIMFKMDLQNKKVTYIDNPQNYNPLDWAGTTKMIAYEKKIYAFEENGKRMLEYSFIENSCRYFKLDCNVHKVANIAMATAYNDKVYVVPNFIDALITVDLQSGIVTRTAHMLPEAAYEFCEKSILPHKLFSCGCRIGKKMWIFTESAQLAIEYDLETEQFEKHKISELVNGCVHAVYKEGIFYILTLDGEIFSWDNSQFYSIMESKEKKEYPYFGRIVIGGNKLWVLPKLGQDILSVDLISKKTEKYDRYPTDFYYNKLLDTEKYREYCDNQRKYYYAMHVGNYIYSVDKISGEEQWIQPLYPTEEEKFMFYKRNNIKVINEKGYKLEGYISNVRLEEYKKNEKEKNTIGLRIWKKIMKD